nr:hypothetical protein [Marseillevirus cajuinensis]
MEDFLQPREWVSCLVDSPIQFSETEEKKVDIEEEEDGFGGKMQLTTTRETKMSVIKGTKKAYGPYIVNLLMEPCSGSGYGIRFEIKGCNFHGENYGETNHKKWIRHCWDEKEILVMTVNKRAD